MEISVEDFLVFCERTIGFYEEAIDRLDEDQLNRVPTEGGNSVYQLTVHAMGATDWWTSHIVAGYPSDRNRDREFESSGTAAEAKARIAETRTSLRRLQPELEAAAAPAGSPSTTRPLEGEWTVGACLMHTYEELAQHLGHVDITVDLVLNHT